MAFKLGNKPLPGIARKGNINKKHGFKVERAKLGDGILGEAHPGRVVIDESLEEGSKEFNRVRDHETQHAKDMEPSEEYPEGKAAFGDDWVRWKGKTYKRENGNIWMDGKPHKEGWEGFPWEKSAMKAEK